ncbi:MFS family permease [Phycicoccus badiiscoriae]|uniref:MFS family permease n=1 Tax=Pedococcus badiiscoriae TaxID=642776 RepID=A0A852WK80_9MICO|nr:MFS family permease [Pedococcus badiiscoriae]
MTKPAAPDALPSTAPTPVLDTARAIRARNAVFVVFALAGTAFATFASRIADSKVDLGLTAGELGLTLFAASAGSVTALPSAGRIANRLGVSRAIRLGMVFGFVGLVVIGVAVDLFQSRWVMAAGLYLLGMGVGVWDVSMNLEGAAVERLLGKTVMPRFHAAFSGGTVISALVGAGMSWAHVPLLVHFGLAIVVSAVLGAWALRSFLPREAEVSDTDDTDDAGDAGDAGDPRDSGEPASAARGPRSAWLEPRTLMIGLVVLAAAFTEGTANDWVSVAFVEGHGVPAWAGVLAFASFLSFMTLGRLLGTRLLDAYGRVPVLRATFALAAVGSVLVVFGPGWLAFVGTAVWGVGASLGFPVGMSASADEPARAAARMSVVATIGYTAFIAGPPMLGFLGDHFTVLRALLAVTGVVALAMLVIPATRERRRRPVG